MVANTDALSSSYRELSAPAKRTAIYIGCTLPSCLSSLPRQPDQSQPDLELFLLRSLTSMWEKATERAPPGVGITDTPTDFVTIFSTARAKAAQSNRDDTLKLDTLESLYLLEFSRAKKLGFHSPYVMLEYPTSQIPLALHSMVAAGEYLLDIKLLSSDPPKLGDHDRIAVYEQNPSGRGLVFDDDTDREEFVKHAVQLICQTPKSELPDGVRMPALDILAEGID